MSIRTRLLSTVLPLALLAGTPALAEVRALLVGVSQYHHLDVDLRGPRNDVRLMAAALLARGASAQAIRILTTPGTELAPGIAPAEDPTRAAILAGLDRLAAEVQPGDTVIFYYSGHGSQAPDLNGDEPSGFDQILLPSDVLGWNGGTGQVENSIVDDELQVKLQAILDRGATVVGILDACHSATGFRDVGGAGVARYVSPQTLGVPADVAAAAEGGQVNPPISGEFVFLYSSQSDERSFEYPLGERDNPDNWFGDFTRNLTSALTEVADLTWAQALAAATDGLRQEQARQNPDGEGPGLSLPVFGGAAAQARIRIEAGRLMSGLLAGMTEGAEIEIFDAAAGGASLGFARATGVTPTDAALDFDGPLPATAYAELYSPGLPPLLRMGAPVAADDGDYGRAMAILGEIRSGDTADGVEWTDEGYDLRLVAIGGELVLVGRDGLVDPAGPGSAPRLPADAAPDVILRFIDRAVRLQRLHGALSAAEGKRPAFGIAGVGLSVTGEVLAGSGTTGSGADCPDPEGPAAALLDGAAVGDCDQVWLSISNTSRTAQDVTVLYVDRDMRIVPIWPEQGLSNRIGFGATEEIGLWIHTGDLPVGIEEIIVIAVPARIGAPRTVLTGLADPGAQRQVEGPQPTGDWLMAAMETDGQNRSFRPGARPDPVKVTRIRVTLTER